MKLRIQNTHIWVVDNRGRSQKRQGTAALQDASRLQQRRILATAFGLRLSSGAFSSTNRVPPLVAAARSVYASCHNGLMRRVDDGGITIPIRWEEGGQRPGEESETCWQIQVQSRDTANRAFTLIEVLIVIAIFAIILVSISTVLFGAIRLRDKTTEAVEAVLPADRAVAIMKQDLAGILPPGNLAGIMSSDTTVAGMGQPVALEIYTTTGTLKDDAPWGEVQKIDYWLQSPTNINRAPAGQELVRGVTRNLLATDTETPQPQSLIQGVQSLQFEYFDGTNWNNSWSSTLSNIPVAIKVSIDFASSKTDPQLRVPIQFLVPVVMQSSTNLTQSEN